VKAYSSREDSMSIVAKADIALDAEGNLIIEDVVRSLNPGGEARVRSF